MSKDYREGLDGLQADMANHQRRYVGEVTADENQKLAVATIERLEKQDADAKPIVDTPQESLPIADVQHREIDGRKYVLDRAPDTKPMFRTATEFENNVLRHAMPRIQLLLSKYETGPLGSPSWRTRTMSAMYHKVKSLEARRAMNIDLADNYERAYQLDLQELLDSSSAIFGDWRKDAPTKIIV